MTRIKKTIDYFINCVKHPIKTAKTGLLVGIIAATTFLSGCNSTIYINGVKVDEINYKKACAIAGMTLLGVTAAYEEENKSSRKKQHKHKEERTHSLYFTPYQPQPLPGYGGVRTGGGPGEQ